MGYHTHCRANKQFVIWRKNALSNELSPGEGGQLKKGDELVIDDAPVVISRRGSNQENQEKRKKDKKGDQEHEWVRVLKIKHQGGRVINFEDRDLYVRKETITMTKAPEELVKKNNEIELQNISDWEKEGMPERIGAIARKWGKLGRLKRSRSTGIINMNKEDREERYKGSGRFWEQEDDGWDVALDMAYGTHKKESGKRQWRIKAVMKGTGDLVGVLIVEEREDHPLYLRWMIGNPEIKGGGTALLAAVKRLLLNEDVEQVDVTSAYSAKESYTKGGFKVQNPNAKRGKNLI